MKKIRQTLLVLIIGVIFISCNSKKKDNVETITVDFINKKSSNSVELGLDSLPILKVAVSAIISPKKTFSYYGDLFEYISQKINHQIIFKQKKTYQEVNYMLGIREVDMAFICSGAYIEAKNKQGIEILAQPVCNGKPKYQAYIITHKSSGIKDFSGLKGKTFAFTDPLSNSGKLYAEKRLNDLNFTRDKFFISTMYTYAHDISIQLVSKQLIDGATVDGLIFEYMFQTTPELVKNINIIEKSEEFGIPPIVVPNDLDVKLKEQLKKILLTIHKDSIGKQILDQLLIEKFIEGHDNDYDGIRKIKSDLGEFGDRKESTQGDL